MKCFYCKETKKFHMNRACYDAIIASPSVAKKAFDEMGWPLPPAHKIVVESEEVIEEMQKVAESCTFHLPFVPDYAINDLRKGETNNENSYLPL